MIDYIVATLLLVVASCYASYNIGYVNGARKKRALTAQKNSQVHINTKV